MDSLHKGEGFKIIYIYEKRTNEKNIREKFIKSWQHLLLRDSWILLFKSK